MKYKAFVTDKQTKEVKIIEGDYRTKQEFIKSIRINGYKVNPLRVKEAKIFDWILDNTNCETWNWRENG